MFPTETDVVILGGGPAGTAAALTLGRYTAHRCVLLEEGHYGAFRVGENVSPAIGPLLHYLGVDVSTLSSLMLPSFGAEAAWGSPDLVERHMIFGGGGHSWTLDRQAFDQTLAASIPPAVTTVMGATLEGATPDDRGWRLRVRHDHGSSVLHARHIIDATGRRAAFARRTGARRAIAERLIGIVAHGVLAQAVTQTTLIETVTGGWWYGAPLPNGRAVIALMTDSDLTPPKSNDVHAFKAALNATRHIASRFAGVAFSEPPRVHFAGGQRLHPCIGPGWIAAGDAAIAFDPLSSLGIGHALSSGIQVARIVDARLAGHEDVALSYEDDVARNWNDYVSRRHAVYAMEQRFSTQPFWRRRRNATAADERLMEELDMT